MNAIHRLLIFGILFLNGCMRPPQVPTVVPKVGVGLNSVRLDQLGLLETNLHLAVRIENRTARSLTIKGGSFVLGLNGEQVGTGLDTGPFQVPPDASIVRTVPIKMGNLSIFTRVRDIVDTRKFNYDLYAILLSEQLGELQAEKNGELDLGRPLGSIRGPAIGDPDEFRLTDEPPVLPPVQ